MPKFLLRFWSRVVAYCDGVCGRYGVVGVDDLPEKLEAQKLYAVGEDGQYWLAVLGCPCGCGDTIQLPMMEGQRPRWTLAEKGLRFPTLAPSVDRTVGCRSHFWLRRGKIEWCAPSR